MIAKIFHKSFPPGTRLFIWPARLVMACLLALPHHTALAEEALPDCLISPLIKTIIVRVIDPQSVETAGGIVIKLAAIEAPVTPITSKGRNDTHQIKAARRLLTGLTLNKPVLMMFDSDKSDRYGRRVAHVFTSPSRKKLHRWVQAEMIKQGLARVFPNTQKATCIKQLLQLEEDARLKKTGLWKNPAYQIIQADNLKRLNRSLGRLQLIEGRVKSVSVRRTRSYINFSKNWRRDFTVTINHRVHRLFTQSGINIKELTGKRIRVRGWLDRHNGPSIKVYRMGQLEILKE